MRFLAMSIGALIVCAGPAMSEHDFCYIDPPRGVKITDSGANPFDMFEYVFVPWAAKRLCSLPTNGEVTTIRKAYQRLGCTPQSDVGKQIEGDLANSNLEVIGEAVFGDIDISDMALPDWTNFCGIAVKISVLPTQFKDEASLNPSEISAIEEMNKLWYDLFAVVENLPRKGGN